MYYRERAKELAHQAQEQNDLADRYANRTLFEPKTGYGGGMLQHCRQLAAYYSKEANRATQLAVTHERLAEIMPYD
ncbi:MAG: hypothetical protein WA869_13225 [Alloacidobacterium sp.]|jgi:hypothetical protein